VKDLRFVLLVTFLITCTGSVALGVRLLLAGLRTRTAPELAYGASLLLMGVGAIVRLVVFGILGGGPEYHALVIGAGVTRLLTLVTLSLGLLVIFRPGVGWARLLVLAFWGLGACGLAVVVAFPGGAPEAGALYQLGDLASALPAVWGSAESYAYHGKLRRRLALGLADPFTAQRFGMWGTSFALAALAGLVLSVYSGVIRGPITGTPAVMAVVQLCLLGTIALTWATFFPPESLRAWLCRRADARCTEEVEAEGE
jgi:hypothetical protein